MSEVIGLLSLLADKGVRLSVSGEQLDCYASHGVLTTALRERILAHKAEIIALLRGTTAPRVRSAPPPETQTEETIAALWRECLRLTRIGIDEDFFRIGGTSLAAMELLTAVQEKLQVVLTARQFFEAPTIRQVAACADAARARAASAAPLGGCDDHVLEGVL